MMVATQTACLDALTEAASEVAATVLGGAPFEAFALEAAGNGTARVGHGAYVGLAAENEPIQVALLADGSGCQRLAKALLGMEPGDDDLEPADVSDAMCEIINIVAGGLKRRVSATLPLTLGLPIFVAGSPQPNAHQEIRGRALRLWDVPVEVLLVTQRVREQPLSMSGASPISKRSAKEHTS